MLSAVREEYRMLDILIMGEMLVEIMRVKEDMPLYERIRFAVLSPAERPQSALIPLPVWVVRLPSSAA